MTVFSIQARMGSTRLPGKVLLPLGTKRILDHVVSRCSKSETNGEVVITTGERNPNDAIREWCRRSSLQCVTGPEDDLLERHRRVLSEIGSNTLVRITGDCPFVPPDEIDRVVGVHRHNEAELTTNNTERMPTGTAVDVLDRHVIDALSEEDATHPVAPLRKIDSQWTVQLTDSEQWTALGYAHTAVDTPKDYWQLTEAVDTVGTDPYDVTRWVGNDSDE